MNEIKKIIHSLYISCHLLIINILTMKIQEIENIVIGILSLCYIFIIHSATFISMTCMSIYLNIGLFELYFRYDIFSISLLKYFTDIGKFSSIPLMIINFIFLKILSLTFVMFIFSVFIFLMVLQYFVHMFLITIHKYIIRIIIPEIEKLYERGKEGKSNLTNIEKDSGNKIDPNKNNLQSSSLDDNCNKTEINTVIPSNIKLNVNDNNRESVN